MIPEGYKSPDGKDANLAEQNTQLILNMLEAVRVDMRHVVNKIDGMAGDQRDYQIKTAAQIQGLEKEAAELNRQRAALWERVEKHDEKIAVVESEIKAHKEASAGAGAVKKGAADWVRWILGPIVGDIMVGLSAAIWQAIKAPK